MSRFRDEMRIARAVLHSDMGDGALVFAWPPARDDEGELIPPTVQRIQVRVHEKFVENGDLKGTNYHYAATEDNSPIAVFWHEGPNGYTPKRGHCFVTEYGKYYRIDSVMPPDDQTTNANVIPLLTRDYANMPEYEAI